jgi:hypothetical protein
MDKLEVTNAMYALCVQAGACELPQYFKSETRESYFNNAEFNDFRLSMLAGHRLIPTANGLAAACRPKQNGNAPHVVMITAPTRGEMIALILLAATSTTLLEIPPA